MPEPKTVAAPLDVEAPAPILEDPAYLLDQRLGSLRDDLEPQALKLMKYTAAVQLTEAIDQSPYSDESKLLLKEIVVEVVEQELRYEQ